MKDKKLYPIEGTSYYVTEDLELYSDGRGPLRKLKPNNGYGSLYTIGYWGDNLVMDIKDLLAIAKGEAENIFLEESDCVYVELDYEETLNNSATGVHKRSRSNTYEVLFGIGKEAKYDIKDNNINVLGLGHYNTKEEAKEVYNKAIEELRIGNFDYDNYRKDGIV